MSNRWSKEDDLWLCEYEFVGLRNLSRDLGRTESACDARIKHLKKCGAWPVLEQMIAANALLCQRYNRALGLDVILMGDEETVRFRDGMTIPPLSTDMAGPAGDDALMGVSSRNLAGAADAAPVLSGEG